MLLISLADGFGLGISKNVFSVVWMGDNAPSVALLCGPSPSRRAQYGEWNQLAGPDPAQGLDSEPLP